MVLHNRSKFLSLIIVILLVFCAAFGVVACSSSNSLTSSTRSTETAASSSLASVQTSVAAPTSEPKPVAPVSTSTSVSNVSFARDIQPVFNKCVTCHNNSNGPGGFSLESGSSFKNLVNVKSTQSALNRVTPGSPDKSYLLNKLMGTQSQVGGSGARMPVTGSQVQQNQISLIQQWISQGAPDN